MTDDVDALIEECWALSTHEGSTLERAADAMVKLRDERNSANGNSEVWAADAAQMERERDEALAVIEMAKAEEAHTIRLSTGREPEGPENTTATWRALATAPSAALDAVKAEAIRELAMHTRRMPADADKLRDCLREYADQIETGAGRG